MNRTTSVVNQMKMGLVAGLLTGLLGCLMYGGEGYYHDGFYDGGGGILFVGGYDHGRDVHRYSQRGSASRGAAHPGGGGHAGGAGGRKR